MTTQDLIESFIESGVSAFKKNYRHTRQGRSLDRHEPTDVCGVSFTSWRELAVYAMGEHILELVPTADVKVIMDGSDSRLDVSLSDDEQRELNGKMFLFLKKWRCI